MLFIERLGIVRSLIKFSCLLNFCFQKLGARDDSQQLQPPAMHRIYHQPAFGILATNRNEAVNSSICNHGRNQATAL